ncbi:MAG: class I SAM-dependent methyltransferase [Pseudomonadota bacterium]
MADKETLDVYDAKAAEYARRFPGERTDPTLQGFMAKLPEGGRVLELGCGPGRTAAALIAAGFEVDAVDASAGMAAEAKAQFGVTVRVATFDQIEGTGLYDGIWANFSLLHAPRADFPRHLAALHQAAKPKGRLHIGMKLGSGEKRDSLGRHYAYYGEEELRSLLTTAGFTVETTELGESEGLAGGGKEPFAIIAAHA